MTADSLAKARQVWAKAGVTDYDLEWVGSRPSRAHYAVEVRGGQVRSIASVTPEGKRFPLKPAEPRFYGVDGLFLVIADELAQLETATPFGQPKGNRAVLRFTLDPKYGYPKSYSRDVVGAPSSLTIDVLEFIPGAAGEGMLIPRNMPTTSHPGVVE